MAKALLDALTASRRKYCESSHEGNHEPIHSLPVLLLLRIKKRQQQQIHQNRLDAAQASQVSYQTPPKTNEPLCANLLI
jgi:hypothetical protein